MNKVFLKTPTAILAAMAILSTTACTDRNEPATTGGVGSDGMIPLVFKGIPRQNAPEEPTEQLPEVKVFHFKGDDFLMCTEINDPYAESIGLPTEGTSDIYCVSGIDLNAVKGETKLSDFTGYVVESGKDSAPLFYSGTAAFDEESLRGGQVEVELSRSIARIDFSNELDASVKISQVVVMNAPASTFVFANGSMPGEETVSYTKEFSEPFQGSETGMFTIFESPTPVEVRIIGEYKDSPLNVLTVLPTVERNKIYTLQIVNMESKTESVVTVKDWETGSEVDAAPDTVKGLYINKENSVIPQDVAVDYMANILKIPASGAKGLKLAFISTEKVEIINVEGKTDAVKISANDPVKSEDGYISSFNIDINPQPNGGISYNVVVHLKDAAGNYNFFEISVPDYHFIETVEMAGLTWMAFNTMSNDPDNQVFPFDGISVEEMYRQNWSQSVGNFFQYGKALSYSPWTKNDPNGNAETPRNIPWNDPDCMPMPPGYHVSSSEEWLQLMPAGTTIPSTYTAANGEKIKAEVVELPGTLNGTPSASANKANLKMRYVRFESLDSHNVLIFPICGMKANKWDEYPGGGKLLSAWTGYWIADDRCLWLFQIGESDGSLSATQGMSRWNYDGFMAVRGIKDHD